MPRRSKAWGEQEGFRLFANFGIATYFKDGNVHTWISLAPLSALVAFYQIPALGGDRPKTRVHLPPVPGSGIPPFCLLPLAFPMVLYQGN